MEEDVSGHGVVGGQFVSFRVLDDPAVHHVKVGIEAVECGDSACSRGRCRDRITEADRLGRPVLGAEQDRFIEIIVDGTVKRILVVHKIGCLEIGDLLFLCVGVCLAFEFNRCSVDNGLVYLLACDLRIQGYDMFLIVAAGEGGSSGITVLCLGPSPFGIAPIVTNGVNVLNGLCLGLEGLVFKSGGIGRLALFFTGGLFRDLAESVYRLALLMARVTLADAGRRYRTVVLGPGISGLSPVVADGRHLHRLGVGVLLAVQADFCSHSCGIDNGSLRLTGRSGRLAGHSSIRGLSMGFVVLAFEIRDSGGIAVLVIAGPGEVNKLPVMAERIDLRRLGLGLEGLVLKSGGVGRLTLVLAGGRFRDLAESVYRLALLMARVTLAGAGGRNRTVVFGPLVSGLSPVMAERRGIIGSLVVKMIFPVRGILCLDFGLVIRLSGFSAGGRGRSALHHLSCNTGSDLRIADVLEVCSGSGITFLIAAVPGPVHEFPFVGLDQQLLTVEEFVVLHAAGGLPFSADVVKAPVVPLPVLVTVGSAGLMEFSDHVEGVIALFMQVVFPIHLIIGTELFGIRGKVSDGHGDAVSIALFRRAAYIADRVTDCIGALDEIERFIVSGIVHIRDTDRLEGSELAGRDSLGACLMVDIHSLCAVGDPQFLRRIPDHSNSGIILHTEVLLACGPIIAVRSPQEVGTQSVDGDGGGVCTTALIVGNIIVGCEMSGRTLHVAVRLAVHTTAGSAVDGKQRALHIGSAGGRPLQPGGSVGDVFRHRGSHALIPAQEEMVLITGVIINRRRRSGGHGFLKIDIAVPPGIDHFISGLILISLSRTLIIRHIDCRRIDARRLCSSLNLDLCSRKGLELDLTYRLGRGLLDLSFFGQRLLDHRFLSRSLINLRFLTRRLFNSSFLDHGFLG